MIVQDDMSHAIIVAPPCCQFELSSLNELRVESLCNQKLLLPLRYFDDFWNTYMSGQDDVSRARMVATLWGYLP